MTLSNLPPWVVLHIPHDSTFIPSGIRSQFLLSDEELHLETHRMADLFTYAIFAYPHDESTVVRSPVSRLVVDVERFSEDALEPMSDRGMGAIYNVTSDLKPLRRSLSTDERKALMCEWYFSHHERLESVVTDSVDKYGRCLIIDGHSFAGTPLPYENADKSKNRPDICIGTDPIHTPQEVGDLFIDVFRRAGWSVAVNDPFSGAIVPASRYGKDKKVISIMVEINKDLYLKKDSFEKNENFDRVCQEVKLACLMAVSQMQI